VAKGRNLGRPPSRLAMFYADEPEPGLPDRLGNGAVRGIRGDALRQETGELVAKQRRTGQPPASSTHPLKTIQGSSHNRPYCLPSKMVGGPVFNQRPLQVFGRR
jgi:hypothetical protein